MIIIYQVLSCFDKDVSHVAYFTNEASAKALVGTFNAIKGSMSSSSLGKEMVVYDSMADYETNNPSARRKKALDKLSAEDKEILGLSRE